MGGDPVSVGCHPVNGRARLPQWTPSARLWPTEPAIRYEPPVHTAAHLVSTQLRRRTRRRRRLFVPADRKARTGHKVLHRPAAAAISRRQLTDGASRPPKRPPIPRCGHAPRPGGNERPFRSGRRPVRGRETRTAAGPSRDREKRTAAGRERGRRVVEIVRMGPLHASGRRCGQIQNQQDCLVGVFETGLVSFVFVFEGRRKTSLQEQWKSD